MLPKSSVNDENNPHTVDRADRRWPEGRECMTRLRFMNTRYTESRICSINVMVQLISIDHFPFAKSQSVTLNSGELSPL